MSIYIYHWLRNVWSTLYKTKGRRKNSMRVVAGARYRPTATEPPYGHCARHPRSYTTTRGDAGLNSFCARSLARALASRVCVPLPFGARPRAPRPPTTSCRFIVCSCETLCVQYVHLSLRRVCFCGGARRQWGARPSMTKCSVVNMPNSRYLRISQFPEFPRSPNFPNFNNFNNFPISYICPVWFHVCYFKSQPRRSPNSLSDLAAFTVRRSQSWASTTDRSPTSAAPRKAPSCASPTPSGCPPPRTLLGPPPPPPALRSPRRRPRRRAVVPEARAISSVALMMPLSRRPRRPAPASFAACTPWRRTRRTLTRTRYWVPALASALARGWGRGREVETWQGRRGRVGRRAPSRAATPPSPPYRAAGEVVMRMQCWRRVEHRWPWPSHVRATPRWLVRRREAARPRRNATGLPHARWPTWGVGPSRALSVGRVAGGTCRGVLAMRYGARRLIFGVWVRLALHTTTQERLSTSEHVRTHFLYVCILPSTHVQTNTHAFREL